MEQQKVEDSAHRLDDSWAVQRDLRWAVWTAEHLEKRWAVC